jgi:hypothetical protein
VVRLGRGGHRAPGVLVEAVELARDLDEAGLDVGLADAAGQLLDEELGQARVEALELARVVVRDLVQAGGGDDVHAARARELGEVVGALAHAERRPLHDVAAAEDGEGLQVGGGRVAIVDLLAGEQRRVEEEVVVRVGDAEVAGREVAEEGAGCHGATSRSSKCGEERWRTSQVVSSRGARSAQSANCTSSHALVSIASAVECTPVARARSLASATAASMTCVASASCAMRSIRRVATVGTAAFAGPRSKARPFHCRTTRRPKSRESPSNGPPHRKRFIPSSDAHR